MTSNIDISYFNKWTSSALLCSQLYLEKTCIISATHVNISDPLTSIKNKSKKSKPKINNKLKNKPSSSNPDFISLVYQQMIVTPIIMSKSESIILSSMSHITQRIKSKLAPSWNLNQFSPEKPFQPAEIISFLQSKSILFPQIRCKTALHPIKRLYILDAINILMNSHKKVAKLMVRTFWNLIDHAKQRGFDPMRLWVHGCLIGKTRRYFGVRYHAKGRGSK